MINQKILTSNKCLIYGQEDYVLRLKTYLTSILPSLKISCLSFPLYYDQPNKTDFDFSIYDEKLLSLKKDTVIIVAFSLKKQNPALMRLEVMGFFNVYPYNSLLDNQLKKEFWKNYFKIKGKDFYSIYEIKNTNEKNNKNVAVYMAKSVYDKPLNYALPDFSGCILPIQAGAALTDKRIAPLTDAIGDNISLKNRRYSEMTVFYWMWKNSKADYIGICHYRRHWINLKEIVEKLRSTDIDVVLPLPTLCINSVYEDYFLKHIPKAAPVLLKVLQELSPEYYKVSKKIFQDKIFYASNMCILKRSVLNALCEWMFPIVKEVEKRIGDLQDVYYNRYAGFCTERLITLYFLYNKENFKIVHGEKIFLGE